MPDFTVKNIKEVEEQEGLPPGLEARLGRKHLDSGLSRGGWVGQSLENTHDMSHLSVPHICT
jgi:hypothetical protein